MHKGFLLAGSALGALAVILGAFGAHKLKEIVPAETVNVFDTGVRYQFYHVFALIIVAILFDRFPGSALYWAGICFIIGIILFSGSLYIITLLKARESVGIKGFGILTPVGGLFFVAGWLLLFAGFLKKAV
ncbi:MAG: DUF423 domain-containing protein [Chitinophagaceae bacterium]|nr:MAG: DUF423 domain-containing protein [Chitinophagaceae bacterium]